jgi:hypothetical protein
VKTGGLDAALPWVATGAGTLGSFYKKQDYWVRWLLQDVPVLMDVSLGYDAHLVF